MLEVVLRYARSSFPSWSYPSHAVHGMKVYTLPSQTYQKGPTRALFTHSLRVLVELYPVFNIVLILIKEFCDLFDDLIIVISIDVETLHRSTLIRDGHACLAV